MNRKGRAAVKIERGRLTILPCGLDITPPRSAHPSATYAEAKIKMLSEIGRAFAMPEADPAIRPAKVEANV